MSELSARLKVYGALDTAVQQNSDLLEAAAAAIPAYRIDIHNRGVDEPKVPSTAGWYEALRPIIGDQDELDLDTALRQLAAVPAPTELDSARRLRVVWAAAAFAPDGLDDATVVDTLTPVAEKPAVAGQVRALMPDKGDGPRARTWSHVVNQVYEQNLVSPRVAALASMGCQDSIVFAPVARADGEVNLDPAASIVTMVPASPIGDTEIDDVQELLQPARWPHCLGSFWCSMTPETPPDAVRQDGVTWFQEVVGDCADQAPWFQPYLRFATRALGDDAFELQYDLCDAAEIEAGALQQDAHVEVDQGVIRARVTPGDGGNMLQVWTTKVIRLCPPLPTGGVAILACVSGWADQTRQMITGCLASKEPT